MNLGTLFCRDCGVEVERKAHNQKVCPDCRKGWKAKRMVGYRAKNKEKIAKKGAEHYAKNKEKKTEYSAEYRTRNEEKLAKYDAGYHAENKERIAERKRTRYQDKKDAETFFQSLAMSSAVSKGVN